MSPGEVIRPDALELAAKMQRMISRGQVDDHLREIDAEIVKRMRYVRAMQSYEALSKIEVDDRVPMVHVKLDPGGQWGRYRAGRVLFSAGALEIVEKRTADAAGGEENTA